MSTQDEAEVQRTFNDGYVDAQFRLWKGGLPLDFSRPAVVISKTELSDKYGWDEIVGRLFKGESVGVQLEPKDATKYVFHISPVVERGELLGIYLIYKDQVTYGHIPFRRADAFYVTERFRYDNYIHPWTRIVIQHFVTLLHRRAYPDTVTR